MVDPLLKPDVIVSPPYLELMGWGVHPDLISTLASPLGLWVSGGSFFMRTWLKFPTGSCSQK